MAATDRTGLRSVRRWPRWIGAGLGSLAARAVQGQSYVDSRLLFYKESGGRTQVIEPVLLLHEDLGETLGQLDLILGYDAISGASPTGAYPTSDVTTSASGHTIASGTFPQAQYRDARKSFSLSWGRKFGAHLPTVDVSYSKENDYVARGAGISDAWIVAHGLGTIHFGASISRDLVEPVTNHLHLPKSESGFSLGYTHILGERDLLDVSASLMQLHGYLDDPYKVVPIGPANATNAVPEHRPGTRSRRDLVVKYGHHYLWDGALKATYRYYNDDWGVQAHTVDLEYDQHLDEGWIVAPEIRLYTQSGASFFASRLDAPRTYMSADYRLAPFDSILGGLTLTKQVTPALSISLGATLQSQRGRDRVVPLVNSQGSPLLGGSISSADLNVTTVTTGLTWRF